LARHQAASPRPFGFVIASISLVTPCLVGYCAGTVIAWNAAASEVAQEVAGRYSQASRRHVVCIFPRHINQNGVMLPFQRGFELLADAIRPQSSRLPRSALGQHFFRTRAAGCFGSGQCPQVPRERVVRSTPAEHITAPTLRQVIVAMSRSWPRNGRSRFCRCTGSSSVRREHPFRPCLIDTTGLVRER